MGRQLPYTERPRSAKSGCSRQCNDWIGLNGKWNDAVNRWVKKGLLEAELDRCDRIMRRCLRGEADSERKRKLQSVMCCGWQARKSRIRIFEGADCWDARSRPYRMSLRTLGRSSLIVCLGKQPVVTVRDFSNWAA